MDQGICDRGEKVKGVSIKKKKEHARDTVFSVKTGSVPGERRGERPKVLEWATTPLSTLEGPTSNSARGFGSSYKNHQVKQTWKEGPKPPKRCGPEKPGGGTFSVL